MASLLFCRFWAGYIVQMIYTEYFMDCDLLQATFIPLARSDFQSLRAHVPTPWLSSPLVMVWTVSMGMTTFPPTATSRLALHLPALLIRSIRMFPRMNSRQVVPEQLTREGIP